MDDINGNTKGKKWYEGYIGILAVITLFAVAFFGLAIIANKKLDFGLSDDSVVIAFVGILATFIVVSNYMQLKMTEDRVDKFKSDLENCNDKIKQYEKEFEEKFDNKITKISGKIEDLEKKYDDIKELKENIIVLNLEKEIYYHTMKSYIFYYDKNYTATLHCAMEGLHYLNELNKIIHYSFEDTIHCLNLLNSGEIRPQIAAIASSQKDAYLKEALRYKGSESVWMIEFIKNLPYNA